MRLLSAFSCGQWEEPWELTSKKSTNTENGSDDDFAGRREAFILRSVDFDIRRSVGFDLCDAVDVMVRNVRSHSKEVVRSIWLGWYA